ncbi:MAG TPA: hypothetical protein VIS09_22510 [Streptomyces sp.]
MEGGSRLLRSLSLTQLTTLGATAAGPRALPHMVEPDHVDRALLDAFPGDGRLGLTALAEQAGTGPAQAVSLIPRPPVVVPWRDRLPKDDAGRWCVGVLCGRGDDAAAVVEQSLRVRDDL